jgi:hypothetical protein
LASLAFDSVAGRVYAVDRNDHVATGPQIWTEFTKNIPGTNRNYRVWVGLSP